MLGFLTLGQIDTILSEQSLGRIGYYDDKKSYITPVTYYFDGTYIYSQTNKGMKLDSMRKNKDVCFEVDVYKGVSNWESVITWGEFEELSDEPAEEVRKFAFDRE